MGPRDPFATRPAPARPAVSSDEPSPNGPVSDGPVRVQAQPPDRSRAAPPAGRRNAVAVGAAVGLGVGLLFVLLTPGQALLVIVLTALGAALGAIVKAAFRDGVDLDAAWRALRRR
ncbi:hypothetical protein [Rubrivirga sp.]|uniref:hypothetical protein n=1 Tax=Rubrivirga sp. TaxID=1885344 RepID=UPI003B52435F